MFTSVIQRAAALAAIATLAAAPAAADPPPAPPAPPAPLAAGPGPLNPAAPPPPVPGAPPVGAPPVGAPPVGAPPVDTGRVASSPPATMTASDGTTLKLWGEDETQLTVPPLTTAISTRDYMVSGVFRGAITGKDAPPKGLLEVGYQIGCGIDMGTGPGVLIGANGGGNASFGVLGAPGGGLIPVPNAGITGGGSVTVSLKPGIVNSVPVTKKQFGGPAPRVAVNGFRVRIDGCVGESFIRSYAVLARVTDDKDSILAWYGEIKKV